MTKLKKTLIYILNTILHLVSKLIPKDDNIWMFGAWSGEKYTDNSKYLFEYVNKYHPEIRAIWLTKNKDVYKLVKSKNYEVYFTYSFQSILLGLKAKFSIFSHGNVSDNMGFLNNFNTKQIQLWHGTPLKKIGFDDNLLIHKRLRVKFLIFPFSKEKIDLMIAMSENDKINFITAFNTSNISILGYPRNDILFNKKKNNNFKITYLPTFRDSIGDKIDLFSNYNFDIEKWDKKLIDLKITLNIKMHPVNKPENILLSKFANYKNFNFLDEVDATDTLVQTDILITDYSSVYFDYLLTDRPIIFAPFDYEKYTTKDREFYYDYDEVTPGPKCKNWDEVLHWIVKFKNDPTLFADERKKIKDKFHKYQDNKSCERVFNEIRKISI